MSLVAVDAVATVGRAADRPGLGAMKGVPAGRFVFAHATAVPRRGPALREASARATRSTRSRPPRRSPRSHTLRTGRIPHRSPAAAPRVRRAVAPPRSTGAVRRLTEGSAARICASLQTARSEKSVTRRTTSNGTYKARRKSTRRESPDTGSTFLPRLDSSEDRRGWWKIRLSMH